MASTRDDFDLVGEDARRFLAKGSFGVVFVGFEKATGNIVAIKRQKIEQEEAQVELTISKTLQSIKQEHVVMLFGAWVRNDMLYLVYEFMCTTIWRDYSFRMGYYAHKEAVQFAKGALEGLHHLHKLKIIHADI